MNSDEYALHLVTMVQSARTALHPGLWPAPNDRCKSQKERKAHAIRKHPTRAPTGAIVISASLASLLGVGYLLSAESKTGGDAEVAAAVGMGSVAAAWLVVPLRLHVALRPALSPKMVRAESISMQDDEQPAYLDVAYLAFGMTYQVSDHRFENPHHPGHRVAPGPVVVRAGGGDSCDDDQPGRGAKQRQ